MDGHKLQCRPKRSAVVSRSLRFAFCVRWDAAGGQRDSGTVLCCVPTGLSAQSDTAAAAAETCNGFRYPSKGSKTSAERARVVGERKHRA